MLLKMNTFQEIYPKYAVRRKTKIRKKKKKNTTTISELYEICC